MVISFLCAITFQSKNHDKSRDKNKEPTTATKPDQAAAAAGKSVRDGGSDVTARHQPPAAATTSSATSSKTNKKQKSGKAMPEWMDAGENRDVTQDINRRTCFCFVFAFCFNYGIFFRC